MAKIADVQEVSPKLLRPYERNAKKHGPEQIEKLKASITEFGFLTPCLIDCEYNLIAGHGRVMAAKELGLEKVPCVFIEGLTKDQRRAYILADNRLGELGEWDFDLLGTELEEILLDMEKFGFEGISETNFESDPDLDKYTKVTNLPQYEPTGEVTFIEELCDGNKVNQLIENINNSGISESEKQFLIAAAARHYKFDYKKIAEYYADASEEMQRLMEESALVLIDFENAIKNGYTSLSNKLLKLMEADKAGGNI